MVDDTQWRVADAGVELMNLEGYDRVTMTRIERDFLFGGDSEDPECRPLEAQIYGLFTSKEALAAYWMVETMRRAFDVVNDRVTGTDKKSVKFFLHSLFDTWIRKLTARRVFVEGFVQGMMMRNVLERRALDDLWADTHDLVKGEFFDPLRYSLSIPHHEDDLYDRQVVSFIVGVLALVTLFWLQDRSLGFDDTYRLDDAATDLISVSIGQLGGGTTVGAFEAAYQVREILRRTVALESLERFLPKDYLEKMPWNLVKMIYR